MLPGSKRNEMFEMLFLTEDIFTFQNRKITGLNTNITMIITVSKVSEWTGYTQYQNLGLKLSKYNTAIVNR